jgi:AraC-like DNA-binding protein
MDVPRTHVDRHHSELGAWELVWRDPNPRLHAHVRRYCGYVESGSRPVRRREVPFAAIPMIISFGPAIRVLHPVDPAAPGDRHTSFVAGLDDTYSVTEHDGNQHGVQVDLSPLGAFQFFGLPLSELARRVVPLDDVLGPEAPLLAERLYEASRWDERFALLDAAIAARLAEHLPASPDVAWAWRRLTETEGRVPIAALTAELGCSRRHLTTRFREQLGMPPKAFARILRFDRAVRRLRLEGELRLAEIAYDCGYYDQPHFNRDFRQFAGSTPSEFLARLLPDGGGVSGI